MARCAACNRLMLGGYREGAQRFCSLFCLTASDLGTFCQPCLEATEPKSPGGTFTFNTFGTRLYFSRQRCPTCHSVIQLKALCALFVPLVPLGRFRVIYVDSARYVGRRLNSPWQKEPLTACLVRRSRDNDRLTRGKSSWRSGGETG